jgi:hypothetical protein
MVDADGNVCVITLDDAEFSNGADILDSRQIIERIEYLESFVEDENSDPDDLDAARRELSILQRLAEEGRYADDWQYGVTMIRDSYFENYAQETAEDCGMINREVRWPYTCIDWERAAQELQQDYSSVGFDGVTYWIR